MISVIDFIAIIRFNVLKPILQEIYYFDELPLSMDDAKFHHNLIIAYLINKIDHGLISALSSPPNKPTTGEDYGENHDYRCSYWSIPNERT